MLFNCSKKSPHPNPTFQGALPITKRIYIYIYIFFFLNHPEAYGVQEPGSQSELQLQPTPQLWQCQILNRLCQARARTCSLVLQRHGQSCCAIVGTPNKYILKNLIYLCTKQHFLAHHLLMKVIWVNYGISFFFEDYTVFIRHRPGI